MFYIKKSRAAKIILLCMGLTVIEKGWVTKTHPFEIGAVVITQEALYALTLGCSMIWRACTNADNSAVDRVLEREISRLANRKCVPDASSMVSANTAQQQTSSRKAIEQVKPVSIKPVPLVRTPSVPIQKTSNVADKARAVVSHVTHEQVAQATYAAIPEVEKIASRQLLHHVAIDWHKEIESRCCQDIRSAQTHAYNHMFTELRSSNPGYTSEIHQNSGVTYRAPNTQLYCYLGPSKQQHTHTLADDISEQRLNEHIQIACDPVLRAAIRNELHVFIKNACSLLYGTLLERIAALVYLSDFHINERTFGEPLYNVQTGIYAKYSRTDGSICIDRLSDMTDAHTIFKKYITRKKKIAPLFEKPCVHARLRNTDQLIKKASKVDLGAIRNNRTNQCYRKMLSAFVNGDMQKVEQIKRTNAQLQGVATLYHALKTEYDKAIQQQEALLKDAYGIAHFGLPVELQDPVYTTLSDHNRTQLQSTSSALENFNDTLKLRQLYKNALHKAWKIPANAVPLVHQALYTLIDCGTIPERIDKIHEVSNNSQLNISQQQAIVQALFLPNGIIKDFAEYDRAQSLQMSSTILQPEHAKTRSLLNQLVYAERICEDDHLQSECAQAIEYLQKAAAADNEDTAKLYLFYAQDIFEQIEPLPKENLILLSTQQQPTGNGGQPSQQNQSPEQKEPKNNDPDPSSPGPLAIALLKAAEESEEKVAEILQKTSEYLSTSQGMARITHPFRPSSGHNLEPLFARMGADINSGKNVIEVGTKIIMDISKKLLEMGSKLPIDARAVFEEIVIEYGGEVITVRGRIHESVIKIGTMFIQPKHVR